MIFLHISEIFKLNEQILFCYLREFSTRAGGQAIQGVPIKKQKVAGSKNISNTFIKYYEERSFKVRIKIKYKKH